MRYRRLLTQLQEHNGTTVCIDLVIGMQVLNWNEERETDKRAAVLTQHLTEDLREEARGYPPMIEHSQQVPANAECAEEALIGAVRLDDEPLLVAAYQTIRLAELIVNNSEIGKGLVAIDHGKLSKEPQCA